VAGSVPTKQRKRKSGVSRSGGADLALLQTLANAGGDMFSGMFDDPAPEVGDDARVCAGLPRAG
jgi:hypothetical protein